VRFKGLDLNLLVALDTLLEERNVTIAAQRVHLSQPAMSAALGRLRNYFKDELLAPHGKKMIATAKAKQIQRAIRELLLEIDSVVSMSSQFDPSTSQRQFHVAASDFIVALLMAPLIRELANEAPGIAIELHRPTRATMLELERGKIDLVVIPRNFISPDHPATSLFVERHVVVGCRSNPAMSRPVTREVFLSHGQIGVALGSDRQPAYAEAQLAQLNCPRRIELMVCSFTEIAPLIVGTRRLALMHCRLAELQAAYLPIAFAPNPFDFPDLEEMMQYHNARANDSGLIWLRDCILRMASLQAPPSTSAKRRSARR
jgi:DNA-binding transcriptional LysR family regulator